ncbi:MAG: type 2 isopentenyl-diphosphate Delta-isomerase [Firmicutes bacterium HGW-Firmicutes-13]|nr:MAG: type 2 isopentenyl-diphosphate Delta-isomerase [Firmicutes bacterium HGW-Firmicutes-13]
MPRTYRKYDHLHYALKQGINSADFDDCELVHQSIPDVDYNNIDLVTSMAGIKLNLPFFINAITGGAPDTKKINHALAAAAKEAGIAMAVGSQTAALENNELKETFKVVRDVYPDGVIFANIGAYADTDMAKRAVDMIKADALQVHLNVPQELIMTEGDRNFKGHYKNIRNMVKELGIPVIVKEVGFGMSRETARILLDNGVQVLDVGGYGGTNFVKIEAARRGLELDEELLNWGIPTLISLVEVLETAGEKAQVISSGGVNNSFNIIKSLSLGAAACSAAGLPVKIIVEQGEEAFVEWIKNLKVSLKQIMTMVGASNLEQLREKPLVIRGKTAEWLEKRGIDIKKFCQRV